MRWIRNSQTRSLWMEKRSRATSFSGHWAALVGKRLGRGVCAREQARRINSPRFGRLKKYAGNCERPAAGRWLAREAGGEEDRASRKLVRTLASGYCALRALFACLWTNEQMGANILHYLQESTRSNIYIYIYRETEN